MRLTRAWSLTKQTFLLAAFALLASSIGCRSEPAGSGDGGEPAANSDAGDGGEGGSSEESAGGGSALQGAVQIDGSSTVYPISEAMASAFGETYSNVKVTVGESGTGGGFKRFTKGETDISDASRPIKWEEHQQCAQAQPPVEYIELPIAIDGLTVVLNHGNDWVDQLTVEQLQKIFLEGGGANTWKDLNPDWPDAKIQIYSPGTDSGTFDFFKEVMVGSDTSKSMRKDMSTSEDDNVLVTGVAGDPNSIGFFGASYYFNNKEKLKAAPIVNPAGQAVLPSPETVLDGTYAPFSRPLFIYVNVNSMKRPEVQRFVRFFMEHAKETAEQVDYVGLPAELYERAGEHSQKKLAGTHFWTEAGEKRPGALAEVYTEANLVKVGG